MGLQSRILVSGLLLTVASLPFSQFGTSLGAALVALSFLVAGVRRELDLSRDKLLYSFMALFAWSLLGLGWTENMEEGLATINIKLPLLIFPLALLTVKWDGRRWLKIIAATFISATFLAAIAGLVNGYVIEPESVGITKWSPFISHIRMGLMVSLGLGILLLEKRLLLTVVYGLVAIVSVWHTQSVTGVLMIAFAIYFALITRLFPLKRTMAIAATCVAAIAVLVAAYFALSPKPYTGELPESTPWGNAYVHHPEKHLEENGFKVHLFLCEEELQREWNKRSDVRFYKQNHLGHSVKDRVIRYLSSKGVPKNGEEIQKLSDEEIEKIESGHTSIRMSTHSGLALRVDALKFELGNYLDGGNPSGNSVTMRLEAFKTGLHIISTNGVGGFLAGVGTGDLPDAFSKAYVETESKLYPEFWKRTHNQYLALWIALGLVGTVLFLVVLFNSSALVSHHSKLAWWMVVISCLAEDTLETQAGVTFAALALTIFASHIKWKS